MTIPSVPRRAAFVVLPLFALAACAGPGPDPLEGVPAFAVEQPTISLIDAGDDPRELTFDVGELEQAETSVAVGRGFAQQVVAAEDVEPQAPADASAEAVTLPLGVSAGEAPAPGADEEPAQRLVHLTVGAPEGPAEDIGSAEGFQMSWRAAANGAASTLRLLAPEQSTQQARQEVESALLTLLATNVVFPEQPVGVGGSWSVEARVTGADAMQRTTTYTVAAIEGDRVTLDVDVAERPSRESVSIDNEIAGELDGERLAVESAETTAQGRIEVEAMLPIPVAGKIDTTTRVVYAGPDPVRRVVQDITTTLEYGT
ncbi:DUF6263 family protein [Corynebacterium auris]|uniref:DUF6263 family protein n=1 Tax=Corynebacterium auris TaxID=44750 RepID=UPI0025B40D1F|nr:DUF6263 family protein [Corynebacterium auris]WJY68385.1 hypothetical protein CAURIS_07450 [Corynebacterium auris]